LPFRIATLAAGTILAYRENGIFPKPFDEIANIFDKVGKNPDLRNVENQPE